MEQIKTIEDILNILQTIEYGWLDPDKNISKNTERGFKKKYILASPEEVLEYKVGTCYDQVELERFLLKCLNIKVSTYFMIYYESKRTYNHTFLVFEKDEKFYWLENIMSWTKGLHEYVSLYDLLTEVRENFKKLYDIKYMDLDYLCVYKYRKPKSHIGLKDFCKHCENGENIII